jgi:hypothetical protein
MIAEMLGNDVWSFEEMADRIFKKKARLPTPEARQSALRRRINAGTDHPPYAEYEGEIYFPKAAFREWALKRIITDEVRRVG